MYSKELKLIGLIKPKDFEDLCVVLIKYTDNLSVLNICTQDALNFMARDNLNYIYDKDNFDIKYVNKIKAKNDVALLYLDDIEINIEFEKVDLYDMDYIREYITNKYNCKQIVGVYQSHKQEDLTESEKQQYRNLFLNCIQKRDIRVFLYSVQNLNLTHFIYDKSYIIKYYVGLITNDFWNYQYLMVLRERVKINTMKGNLIDRKALESVIK